MTSPKENRHWWALGAITLAVLAVGLDITLLSVALPTLAGALHASESELQWFSAGYALALAAAMMPAGVLGDRFGRKRMLIVSLLLFGSGSVVCALSPTPAVFTAARVVMGVAGAGLTVASLSIITVIFPEKERPRAVGVWAAANFLAMPLGPVLGGWMLSRFWWGWVFLMNAPVVLIGLTAVVLLVPESRAPRRPALDPLGMLLSAGGIAVLVYGFIEAGRNGWSDAGALTLLAAGVAFLVGFGLWQNRLARLPDREPLVDLTLFRSASFTWGVILAAVGILAMVGVLFTMPQYFQGIRGLDAQGSGLGLLPIIGGLMLGAIPAGRVAMLIGAKLTTALGFALLAAGLVIGAGTTATSDPLFTAAWMALLGLGVGLALTCAASAALAVLPSDRAGVGSAVMSALQKLGAPLGTAVIGSALTAAYLSRLNVTGLPHAAREAARSSVFAGIEVARSLRSTPLLHSVDQAFIYGMDIALLLSAAFAVAGLILALIFIPRRPTGDPATGDDEAGTRRGDQHSAEHRHAGDRAA